MDKGKSVSPWGGNHSIPITFILMLKFACDTYAEQSVYSKYHSDFKVVHGVTGLHTVFAFGNGNAQFLHFLNSPPSFKMECKNFSHLLGKSIGKKLDYLCCNLLISPTNPLQNILKLPPKFWDLVPTLPTYRVFLWQHFTSAFYRQELLHSQALLSNARSIHIFCLFPLT